MVKRPYFTPASQDLPDMLLKNWVLIILHDKGAGRKRDAHSLTNEVFISVKELLPSIEPKFEFKSECGGPYSDKVAQCVKQLLATNMLVKKENDSGGEGGYSYNLTKSGLEKANKIILKLPENLRDNMSQLNFILGQMGPTGMLQYIHSIYPEYVFLRKGGENIV
ncbi:MAG: hypothetical protein JSV56_06940 [Methanomassiliicoccales archaeon]|nr:MAG: hypothetical protein JSV56_06940 [Methanomassiliicoccales archaeon]